MSPSADWPTVAAAHAVWRITGDAAEAIPGLLTVITPLAEGGYATPVTIRAVRHLGEIGPAVAAAVPVLRDVLVSDRRLTVPADWHSIAEDDELCAAAACVMTRIVVLQG
jgi:hypothetical protein